MGLRWDRGGTGYVVGVEGGGMASFGDHNCRGGGKAPADHLQKPAEVPPAGVEFREVRHPRHRDGVPACRR